MQQKNQNPLDADVDACTGDVTTTLWMMYVVEELRLNAGNTFPTKAILQLRIAEEINLQQIATSTLRSDLCQLLVVGNAFYVKASSRVGGVWKVSTCIVRAKDGAMPVNQYTCDYAANSAAAAAATIDAADEPADPATEPEDDTIKQDDADDMDDQVSVMDFEEVDFEKVDTVPVGAKCVLPHSPYQAKWIVPLIRTTIAETPYATSKTLKDLLCVYGKDFAWTRLIINEA
jgi:hypothetical protein